MHVMNVKKLSSLYRVVMLVKIVSLPTVRLIKAATELIQLTVTLT